VSAVRAVLLSLTDEDWKLQVAKREMAGSRTQAVFRSLLEAICLKESEVDFQEEGLFAWDRQAFCWNVRFPWVGGPDEGLGCSWTLEELAAMFPVLSAQQQMAWGC